MRLEERIVLDAAGAATAGKTDPTKDQAATSSSSDAAAKATDPSGSSTDVSAKAAASAPAANSSASSTSQAAASGPVRVLVIDSSADPSETLASAALNNVLTVCYDGHNATPDQILAEIKAALGGKKAESIAFAAHELGAGRFHLAGSTDVDNDTLTTDKVVQQFWKDVGGLLSDSGRVDLLNCGLASTIEGAVVAADLESLTGHAVASSSDATGSADHGGNWILENGDVNLVGTYFSADRITEYHGTLAAETIVTGSGGTAGDGFGKSVSISGNYAVVGAYLDDVKGTDAGAAYLFFWNGSAWTQQTKITASDGAAGDWFGYTVSISGDYVAVGAGNHDVAGKADQGAVYVYQRGGTFWSQVKEITAADGAAGDYFGTSVALSSSALLVGTPGADIGGRADQGAVYSYSGVGAALTFGSKTTASDGAAGDYFGWSVAVSGGYAVVGAKGSDARGVDSGAAYIYSLSGSSLSLQNEVTASDGAVGDSFGASVAISGDTVVVGAYLANLGASTDAGAAYVFSRSGSTWSQSAKLTAAAPGSYDQFGESVGVSGTRIVVGADMYNLSGRSDAGAAYEFEYTTGVTSSWVQLHLLTASDYSQAGHFGTGVAIDGTNVLVGAIRDSSATGRGYVYDLTSSGLPGAGGDLPGSGGGGGLPGGGGFGVGYPTVVNAIDAQSATENMAFSYTMPTTTFTDDGGVAHLTYSASSALSSSLPSWLTFNPATRTLSGTPGDYDPGTYIIRITATDQQGHSTSTTFDLVVANVNDAPEISGAIANRAVNDVSTVTPFDAFVIVDKDAGQLQTVTVTLDDAAKGVFTAASLTASHFFLTSPGTYFFSGTAEQAQVAIRQLVYDPTDNRGVYGSTETTQFTVRVTDDVGASVSNSATTVVSTTSNRPATATGMTQTQAYIEDAASVGLSPIVVSDPDAGDVITVSLTLADRTAGLLSTGSGNGETFANGVWTVTGTAAQVNTALAAARFIPGANYDRDTTITVHVADRAGYGPSDGTITLDVTPVEDTPTTGPSTVTTLEDTAHVFTLSDFVFNDPDTGDVLQKVQVCSTPGHGRLVLNTGGGDVNVASLQEITRADIAAGHLKFIPGADENGSGYANFTYKVSDGTAYSVLADTLTLNVTAVEDAPTAASGSVTTSPNLDYTFAAADFHFSDVDAGDTLTAVTITQLPTAGSMLLNGLAVSAGQSVTRADINAGHLIFRPETDMGGSGYSTFNFTVNDGTLSSVQSYAMSVNVDTPGVNDAPAVIRPAQTLSMNEDGTLALSGGNRISIVDVDSGGSQEVVTLTSAKGLMSLGSTTGLTFTAGQATGSTTMTFRGTLADINAALSTLSFSSDQYFNSAKGQATIQVDVNDLGNTGAGGAMTASKTISVTVNPVADKPQDVTVATLEDTRTSTFNLLRNVNDGAEVTYFKVSGITGGTLYDHDGHVVADGAYVSYAESQGMTFMPAADRNAQASFSYQASTDGVTVGAKSLTPATVAVNITPVGDTPQNVTVATVEDTVSQTFNLARNVSDGAEVTSFHISNIVGGTLHDHDGNLVNNGDYITYAESQGMTFTPAADRNAQAHFDYQSSQDGVSVAAQSLTAARVNVNITPVGDTPQDVQVVTVEDTLSQTFNLARNVNDGAEVTAFKISNITGGTLYDHDGHVVADGAYVSYAESQGMTFLPSADRNGQSTFSYQASEDGTHVSAQSLNAATVTVGITAVGDTPRTPDLIVAENALSDPIVLARNAADGAEVTSFRISGIIGGSLYLNDGVTKVHNGDYVTYAQGQAGLRFQSDAYSTTTGGFDVESSQDGAHVAAQSAKAHSTVSVLPIASTDTPFSFTVRDQVFQNLGPGSGLTFTATLADGSALPAWLHFDPATRTFSGTPKNGDVGATTVRITATNLNDPPLYADVALTVQYAPQVALALTDQATLEKGEYSASIPAGTFTDRDGDPLALKATLADGSALPAWLHFDPATGTFSGRPANDDVGVITVRVTATDPVGAKASSDFSLEVINVNDAPTVTGTLAAKSIVSGNTLTLALDAGMFHDVDKGDVLTYSASLTGGGGLPEWLHFDPSSRTFSGLPPDTAVGLLNLEVTATDLAGAKASTTLALTVTDAPKANNDTPGRMTITEIPKSAQSEPAQVSFSSGSLASSTLGPGSLASPSLTMSLAGPIQTGEMLREATRANSGLSGFGSLLGGDSGSAFSRSSLLGSSSPSGTDSGSYLTRSGSSDSGGLGRAMSAFEGRFGNYLQRLSTGLENYSPDQLRNIQRSLSTAEAYGERLSDQMGTEKSRMNAEEEARYAVRLQEYREVVQTLRAQVEGTLRLAQSQGRQVA